jgi:hypothetical protein
MKFEKQDEAIYLKYALETEIEEIFKTALGMQKDDTLT